MNLKFNKPFFKGNSANDSGDISNFSHGNPRNSKQKLHIWESALLIALCFTLLSGLWAQASSERLSGELVRLHIVANSDSETDQALKLVIRDEILAYLEPKLENAKTPKDAYDIISAELSALSDLAAETAAAHSAPCSVTASLRTEPFPTRDYGSFSLPAGDYISLRLVLGQGQGRNWWCVVFPPLCLTSAEADEAFSELSDGSEKLIRTQDGDYTLRFHIVELFERLKQALTH
ncbi:MAG: stage II sporulation protein R [Oscillospiraceae bacterium]|nr:stage II sporulation protein R [Oscillospiraceae bacterium]